jgi:tetratricopeptide (TPR) repeat protein
MFKRVIGKKCTVNGCRAYDINVDTALNVCEECGTQLTPVTVINTKAVAASVVLVALILGSVGYMAVIKIKHYLAVKAAETVEQVARPLTEAARAQIKDLLGEIQRGGDAAKAQQQIEQFQREYGLRSEDIEKLKQEVRANPELASTSSAQSSSDANDEMAKRLRAIYADGIKTADEQAEIERVSKQYSLDAAQVSQKEQETKDRFMRSEMSLKQGLAYVSQLNYSQALKEFMHSTEMDPDNAFAWANLGAAYLNLNQQQQAMAACERALAIDPNNWLAHYNLGSIHANNGARDNAIRELSEALRLVASDQSQKITKAEVLAQMKTDQTLKTLHDDSRFRQLLARN